MNTIENNFEKAVRHHHNNQLIKAADYYMKAINAGEHLLDSFCNLSVIHYVHKNYAEAEKLAKNAIQQDPKCANAWNNLGLILYAQKRLDKCLEAYQKVVTFEPNHSLVHGNLADVLDQLGRSKAALDASEKAIRLAPNRPQTLVQHIYRKLGAADWNNLDQYINKLHQMINRGSDEVDPFLLIFICNDPLQLQKAAKNLSQRTENTAKQFTADLPAPTHKPSGKIRIGYLSANFNTHPVAAHVLEVMENHDPDRFEVYAYCYTAKPSLDVQRRLTDAGVIFQRIAGISDRDALEKIRSDKIDIAVDLMGFTDGSRLGILATRAAPIQISWIGFAGTLGADWIDHIIADDVVIPVGDEQFYSEKIIRMPVSYQANDSKRPIHPIAPKRSDYGLPENAPVFCCFNKTTKINPAVMGAWAQILRQVPNGVLWIWPLNELAATNLHNHFKNQGIAPDRIIMAKQEPLEHHLARHAICDLFLDTFPYTGHATSSNALYAGCPVLTVTGPTFASRVSASLLSALDMQDFIAESPQHYVQKAIDYVRDPIRMKQTKAHLEKMRTSADLFSGKAFAKALDEKLIGLTEHSS